MERVAPELVWDSDCEVWQGLAPVWPFDRDAPAQLDAFLDGDRLKVVIEPRPAHPAVPPRIWPIEPAPTPLQCTDAAWHTLGNGSLCVVREYYTWTGAEPCAAVVPTAAGWFLEFLLMMAGAIDAMTVHGIETATELDHLFVPENRAQQS